MVEPDIVLSIYISLSHYLHLENSHFSVDIKVIHGHLVSVIDSLRLVNTTFSQILNLTHHVPCMQYFKLTPMYPKLFELFLLDLHILITSFLSDLITDFCTLRYKMKYCWVAQILSPDVLFMSVYVATWQCLISVSCVNMTAYACVIYVSHWAILFYTMIVYFLKPGCCTLMVKSNCPDLHQKKE